jgi:hypothetical protein
MSSPETKGNALSGVRCSIMPGSGNYHFTLAGCDDCNVRDLAGRSLEYVEDRYHTGYVSQAMYEAYMHVWATSAVRFGDYAAWGSVPTDPEVVALAELFRKALVERQAARA